jgi:hypothetical protein
VYPAENSGRLEKDANRSVDRAATPHEPDRLVEIDVAIGGYHHRARPAVTGVRKLLHAPANDPFVFGFVYENRLDRRSHCSSDRSLDHPSPLF